MERRLAEYDRMIERIKLAAAQIDILSEYDPDGKERRVQELFDSSHYDMVNEPTTESRKTMEKLIIKYDLEIGGYRRERPEIEQSEEVRKKLSELEELSDSCSD